MPNVVRLSVVAFERFALAQKLFEKRTSLICKDINYVLDNNVLDQLEHASLLCRISTVKNFSVLKPT
jgi:hypothetical protein